MTNHCDTKDTLSLRLDYSKILREWEASFLGYRDFNRQGFEESLPRRAEVLNQNTWFIIRWLYKKGRASVYDLDMGLREVFGNNVELGGGSITVSRITDILKQEGVIQKNTYPYRLTRGHRDALDQIYLNKSFS